MIVITGYLKPSAKTACEIQVLPLKPRCDLDLEMRSKGRNRRPRSQRITYPNHDRMFRISPPSEPVKIHKYKKHPNSAGMFGSNGDVLRSNSGSLRGDLLDIIREWIQWTEGGWINGGGEFQTREVLRTGRFYD